MIFSKKKVLIDTLIYTFLPKISFIASILVLPWISPFLTLKDYGLYGIIMSYVAIFGSIMGLGQVILLQNSFFTHCKNYKLIWRRSFALMVWAGVLSSIIFALIVKLTLKEQLGSNANLIIVFVSIYLIFNSLEPIIINYYTLKEKAIPYAYLMGIIGLSSPITFIITIKYLGLGYLGWVMALPVTAILTGLFFANRIFFKEKIYPEFRLKKCFIKRALKIGLPLTPHQISLYILGVSDRLLLEFFKLPIKQIGFYSQGYNLGSQGNVIVVGVFQAFSKKIQEAFRSNSPKHKIFIYKTIIIIPVGLSLILFSGSIWAKEVFSLLFKNPELQQAYPITIIVLSSYMFWSIYTFFTYPLSINNKTFSISSISIVAAIVNIIGNIILIPFFGIWASLGVTYISYIVFGYAGLLNKQNRVFLNGYVNIIKLSLYLLILNIILFLTSYLAKDFIFLYKIFLNIVAIAGFYTIYTLITKKVQLKITSFNRISL